MAVAIVTDSETSLIALSLTPLSHRCNVIGQYSLGPGDPGRRPGSPSEERHRERSEVGVKGHSCSCISRDSLSQHPHSLSLMCTVTRRQAGDRCVDTQLTSPDTTSELRVPHGPVGSGSAATGWFQDIQTPHSSTEAPQISSLNFKNRFFTDQTDEQNLAYPTLSHPHTRYENSNRNRNRLNRLLSLYGQQTYVFSLSSVSGTPCLIRLSGSSRSSKLDRTTYSSCVLRNQVCPTQLWQTSSL